MLSISGKTGKKVKKAKKSRAPKPRRFLFSTGKATKRLLARREAKKNGDTLRGHHQVLKTFLLGDDQNEGNTQIFILQRMPTDTATFDITTCRHPFCPAEDHVSPSGSYRVSIEWPANFEDSNQYNSRIPLRAKFDLDRKAAKSVYSRHERGRGRNVESWWCLSCLEEVWLMEKGFVQVASDLTRFRPPQISDLSILEAEHRSEGPYNHLYHLPAPQRCAFEKWLAMIAYQEHGGSNIGPDDIAGETGTLYEDEGTRDIEGIDGPTGEIVELTVAEIGTKKLSEVLRLVDERVEALQEVYFGSAAQQSASEGISNEESSSQNDADDEDEEASSNTDITPRARTSRSQQKKKKKQERDSEEGVADIPTERLRKRLKLSAPKKMKLKIKGPSKQHPSNQSQHTYNLRSRC